MENVYFITSNKEKSQYTIKFHGFSTNCQSKEEEDDKRARFMKAFPLFKPVTKGAFLHKVPMENIAQPLPVSLLLDIVRFLRKLEENMTSDKDKDKLENPNPVSKTVATWSSNFCACKSEKPCGGCKEKTGKGYKFDCDQMILTITICEKPLNE